MHIIRAWIFSAASGLCGVTLVVAGCGSDPSAPGGLEEETGVYYGVSIDGNTYPFEFAAADTVFYHTLAFYDSGRFRAWCEVSRSGARSIECAYAGTFEEVSPETLLLVGEIEGDTLEVTVRGDTLLSDGDDAGPEVHVRCPVGEVGRVPCESDPPGTAASK
jgi:hypothetical protein